MSKEKKVYSIEYFENLPLEERTHLWFPMILKNNKTGEPMAIFCGKYYYIDDTVTQNKLSSLWKHSLDDKMIYQKTFIVESSSGNGKYTVTEMAGKVKCSCPGFRFHGYCKHQRQILEKIKSK